MKTRRTILILGIMAILLVTGIFIWQLGALPSLRLQVASGLHSSLQRISESTAEELDRSFSSAMTEGNARLSKTLSLAQFNESQLDALSPEYYRVTSAHPLSEAWLLALPDHKRNTFKVFEYKKPSRYLRDSDFAGVWRESTDLSSKLKERLDLQFEGEGPLDQRLRNRWASSLDSNLVLRIDRTFDTDLLIGNPVFEPGSDSVKALVFSQLNRWYFSNVFLRDFFLYEFWSREEEREGLRKKYLQFGVLSAAGDRMLYHSVAYGNSNFEHLAPLSALGSWLPEVTLAVGFRDATVEEVADSIYQRNFNFIIAMFILLLVLLILIFFSARRLLRLSRLKTEFVANVSHEIRTPLSSIRLAADTLRLGRTKNPEQLLEILNKETDRLQHMVATLLDFSQLERGRKKYMMERLETGKWLAEVKGFFKAGMGEGLEVVEKGKMRGEVEVDRTAMEQVFNIFIDNARKYAPEDQHPILKMEVRRRGVRVGLEDHGIGIHRDDQQAIFEKFVRVGNLDVHDVKGHGIGLSMAKAIVRDHGGKIWVESKIGEGSTFYIELPFQKSTSK